MANKKKTTAKAKPAKKKTTVKAEKEDIAILKQTSKSDYAIENDKLTAKVEELDYAVEDLKESLFFSQKENERAKDKVIGLETSVIGLLETKDELTEEIDRLNRQLEDIILQTKQAIKGGLGSENMLVELQEDNAALKARIAKLTNATTGAWLTTKRLGSTLWTAYRDSSNYYGVRFETKEEAQAEADKRNNE